MGEHQKREREWKDPLRKDLFTSEMKTILVKECDLEKEKEERGKIMSLLREREYKEGK